MDRRTVGTRRRDLFVGGDGAWVKRITVFFLDAIVPPRGVDGSAHVEEWLEMVEWVSFLVAAVLIIVAAIIAVIAIVVIAIAFVVARSRTNSAGVGVGDGDGRIDSRIRIRFHLHCWRWRIIIVVAAVFVAVVVVILDGHVQCTHAVVIVIGGHGVVWL